MRRYVTCTVVSVMPYILTSAGRASPKRAIQPRSDSGASASPPKITWRSAKGSPVWMAGDSHNWRKADGVWFSTVTPCVRSRPANSSGARLIQYGTTTSLPPVHSAPKISQTEKSKA
ncbi:Uncharacterised protein [Bordetella ansorpii]|uniref:Uncharacterized protein n=1 Tax=Bordetella ansorpii TaxID=288768 RepID=A0A157MG58_9BORD|nr:Uncharacterised protein [Bordetella ansorpii]